MVQALSTYSDDRLLEEYRSTADKRLVGELYKRYAHLLLGLSIKYLKDEEAAKDAVVDIFELIMEKLLHNEVIFFRSWLYMVAKNHLLRRLQKNKNSREVLLPSEEFFAGKFMENGEEMSPNRELELVDVREQQLHEAINALKEEQQVCIRRFYLEKESYTDIASATGYDIKQVKSAIQNGKRNLKLLLEEKRIYA